jgi:dolichol kinase
MCASALQSVAGSLSCFLGGWLAGWIFLLYFQSWGVLEQGVDGWEAAAGSALAALAGALVESLPWPEVDNVTVPLAVAVTARCFYGF